MWNPALAVTVQVPILGDPVEVETPAGVFESRPVIGYVDGVHVNLPEALMTADLEAARVTPSTPQSLLAGVDTAFLLFEDEEAAQAAATAAGLWLANVTAED